MKGIRLAYNHPGRRGKNTLSLIPLNPDPPLSWDEREGGGYSLREGDIACELANFFFIIIKKK